MTRTPCSRWGLLALLLLASKAIIVLSLGDVFFYGEELEKGAAAKAMIDGLDVPHYQLAYHYYEGGGFVVSHCIAVAFLVVGQNLLALKLVALAFQAAILAAGVWATLRLFGRTAATWFGVLFLLGPASMQKLSMLSLGIHFEAGLFLLLSFGLGARLVFDHSKRRRDWFLLGLVTGFGIYFSYLVLVMGMWVGLVLLVLKRRELASARGLAMFFGTAIGLIPWFAMVSLVGAEVWNVHGSQLLATSAAPESVALFGETLRSLFFSTNGEFSIAACTRAVMFVCALSYLLWNHRDRLQVGDEGAQGLRTRALYVAGFMVLLLAALLASGFVPGSVQHYFYWSRLVPFWLFGTVIVAAALGALWKSQRSGARIVAGVLLSVLVSLGVLDTRSVALEGRPDQLAANWEFLREHKGYSYHQYFEKVMPHFDGSLAERIELVESFRGSDASQARTSAVAVLCRMPARGELVGTAPSDDRGSYLQQATELLKELAGDDESRLAAYKLGLGHMIVELHGWRRAAAMRWARHLPEGERNAALEALGRFGWKGNPSEAALREALRRARNYPDMAPYIRGLGCWAYAAYRLDPAGFEALRQELPRDVAHELGRGYDEERASNRIGNGAANAHGLASN